MRRLEANPALLCAFQALKMTLFPIAVITLFWRDHLGFSMTEILLLQALFGLTVAVCEFPSGYLADRLGYRRTMLTAVAIALVGWVLYTVAYDFVTTYVAEAVLGIGLSLISGTDSALMFESLKETGREGDYRMWEGRFRFWGQTAEATAALTAGVLYVIWPRLPFVLEIVVWLAAGVVAWRLVEPARRLPPEGGHLRQIGGIVRAVLGGNRRLAPVVFLATVLALSSFIPVWLIAIYASDAGVPETWIGPLWAVANYTVAFGALSSNRVAERIGVLPTLLLCVALMFAGYAGLALTFAVWGFVFYYFVMLMRGLVVPVIMYEEQKAIPSTDRAGYVSMRSLLFRGSFFVIGPLLGVALDAHGQHPVLLVLGPVLAVLALVGWLWLRRRPEDGPRGAVA